MIGIGVFALLFTMLGFGLGLLVCVLLYKDYEYIPKRTGMPEFINPPMAPPRK